MSLKQKILSFFLLALFIFSIGCGKMPNFKKTDARSTPTNALERARKNIDEGRGASLGGLLKKGRGTNYEFSTSNPMWRASLEILDFLPLSVVDYSGGMIVTDWYSDEVNSNSSIKITVRFLSNEVQTNSLKIIVHEKKCTKNASCSTKILNSKIRDELLTSIIRKAAIYKAELKKK
jgi:hypothetical protein